ncbi:hypothetical protein E1263_41475 [Kribbella antibiotica]|uniref:PH domain-containing protein n=1 Tax=Kribbella antibiotica TaxID=190195 RepID=A0A4R4YI14_9ACTN|nr:hypothetical protein [Kribbella antibiotica]TDD43674.1 hypothetical protein E1263_41475 [Kribbella antibiotica]
MPPADAWNTALDEAGRVVFPPRRGRLYLRLAAFGLVTIASLATNLDHLRADGITGTIGVLRLTALAAFVYGTVLTLVQLIANKPVVTIDAEGITRGRRLPWSGIAQIDEPTGFTGARSIQVRPVDRRTRPIRISLDNVEELDAFAHWIRSVQTRYTA